MKKESELSKRTSRMRPIDVRRVGHVLRVPSDARCSEANVALSSCANCCLVDCPRLDCTRAIGLLAHETRGT